MHDDETVTTHTLRRIRDEIIEECAMVCDKYAAWAESLIEGDPASRRSQMFAGISTDANDCAAMIRDLKSRQKEAANDT